MKMNKMLLYTCIMCGLLSNTGCATYMAKNAWDDARQRDAVRVEADGNSVLVGVDILSAEYLKDNWKWAVPAAIVDGACIYGTYELVNGLNDSGGGGDSSSAESGRDSTIINNTGDGNTVEINNSQGSTVSPPEVEVAP